MKKEQIHLFELEASAYGLVISPMLRSFSLVKDITVAFDPHRHDYYSLFLLEAGHIEFHVDAQQIIMGASTMLLICPGQVHQCLEARDISGWVVSFDGKFLDPKARSWIEQAMQHVVFFNLSTAERSFFTGLLALIYESLQEAQPGTFQQPLLHAMLNAVFYKAADLYTLPAQETGLAGFPRPLQISQEFKQLVKKHFRTLKRPADYAALMHVSVSYLNNTIKAVTGFPATYFVQQETIGEAQRQLLYTSKSVKEISFDLGYHDEKYFIRLFGKVAALSPSVFRKTNHNKPALFSNVVMMFKTDLSSQEQATMMIGDLLKLLPSHQINFHKHQDAFILQIEGRPVHAEKISYALQLRNFNCTEINHF